jgi:hypothetical protein
MNSADTSNSQLRIPTRVFQGHIVTMDLPTLGTNHNSILRESTTQKGHRQSGKHQADRPQCPGGLSARRARTVRNCYPNLHGAQKKRTVRDGPANRLPCHGPSDILVRTVLKFHAPKVHRQNRSKERRSRTCTSTKNSRAVRHLADGLRWPRGWSAATSPTLCGDLVDGPPSANQHSWETEKQPLSPVGEFRKTRHPRNVKLNKVPKVCFSGAGDSRFSETWNLRSHEFANVQDSGILIRWKGGVTNMREPRISTVDGPNFGELPIRESDEDSVRDSDAGTRTNLSRSKSHFGNLLKTQFGDSGRRHSRITGEAKSKL